MLEMFVTGTLWFMYTCMRFFLCCTRQVLGEMHRIHHLAALLQ